MTDANTPTPARPALDAMAENNVKAMKAKRLAEIRERIAPHGVCAYAAGDCFAAELLVEVDLRLEGLKIMHELYDAATRAHTDTLRSLADMRGVIDAAETVNKLAVQRAQNYASAEGHALYRENMSTANKALDEAFQQYYESALARSAP